MYVPINIRCLDGFSMFPSCLLHKCKITFLFVHKFSEIKLTLMIDAHKDGKTNQHRLLNNKKKL